MVRLCPGRRCGKPNLRAKRTTCRVVPTLRPEGLARHLHSWKEYRLRYVATGILWVLEIDTVGGREGERERGREGGWEGGWEGGREEGKESEREEGGRERERRERRKVAVAVASALLSPPVTMTTVNIAATGHAGS